MFIYLHCAFKLARKSESSKKVNSLGQPLHAKTIKFATQNSRVC